MTTETWNSTKAEWRRAFEALVGDFRPKYLAEVQRLAESLRSEFEAGGLRGYLDDDDNADPSDPRPMDRLEDLCAEHFGIQVARSDHGDLTERDPVLAQLVVASSPSADDVSEDAGYRGIPGSVRATYASARDVFAVAIARGWRKLEKGEWTPEVPTILRWAQEVRS